MENIDIDKIRLDLKNPRIRNALEKYGDKVTDERVYFALRTQSSDSESSSGFSKLKESVRASGGINIPITVVKKDGSYICIDGNTRLMIYRDFKDKGFSGNWESISAVTIEDNDIEKVRMTAHIVGPRDWPAFEKAQYLYDLYKDESYSFNEIANICGGNQKEIEQLIDAYEDMLTHYKGKAEHFDITRFSGFVELQKSKVKESIINADCTLDDFGEWIREGWIKKLADVRKLPKVLGDPKAKEIFLEGGIDSIGRALNLIIVNKHSKGIPDLSKLNLNDLAMLMSDKIKNLTRGEMQDMRQDSNDILASLRDLETDLNDLINDLDNR